MKKLLAVLVFVAFCLVDTLAQLKVREDGRINLCYETANNGANAALYLGSYIHPDHPGEDNGLFTIEVLSDYGSLNICRDWPNPNWKNFLICIESNYDVGIGKTPSYKLDVDGDIATYGTLRVASDGRLKTNVKSLSEEPSKIYSLEAKAYQKTTPEGILFRVRLHCPGTERSVPRTGDARQGRLLLHQLHRVDTAHGGSLERAKRTERSPTGRN